MAKLPSTFRARNRTTRQYRELYARLPRHIQELARVACLLFDQDPDHPSLRRHLLDDRKKAKHHPDSFSVSITIQYRTIYFFDEQTEQNVWYWIGTHAQYDKFTGKR
jgi:hypothetical protein